jgi:hypothetical protein
LDDRAVRSLASLQTSGSSSRILNLLRVFKDHGATEDHRAKPMFQNPVLNRGLIIKHRLRANERDLFPGRRTRATKIVLPIDRDDLRSGGRYTFVGQQGYEQMLRAMLGPSGADSMIDRKVLEVLDALPSFDPFILREQLRRSGVDPASCYFSISPGDLEKMFTFVQTEVRDLVKISLAGEIAGAGATAAFVEKLMGANAVLDLQPLRHTLKLGEAEYEEGLFCWRGFLYYKWSLQENFRAAPALADHLRALRINAHADAETRRYIVEARERLAEGVFDACSDVEETLKIYDRAFLQLTARGDALAFRNFLLSAPAMFLELGERLGALNHIVSFWKYRFPQQETDALNPYDLVDLLMDFEASLSAVAPRLNPLPALEDTAAYL